MDKSNETLEVVIAETGEIRPIKVNSLVSDIRNVLLQHRREQRQSTTWGNLSEAEQQTEIDAMTDLSYGLVSKAFEMVALGKLKVVHAQLESFTVKDGATKIVAKGRADDAAVVKLNQVGTKLLKITVLDESQFDEEQEVIVGDPDQPELLPDAEGLPEKTELDSLLDKGKDEDPPTMDDKDDLHKDLFNPDADIEGDKNEETQAYLNGYDAQVAEKSLDDNPYPVESLAAKLWQTGHDAAASPVAEDDSEAGTEEEKPPKEDGDGIE